MFGFRRTLLLIVAGLIAAVAGCQSTGQSYLTNGIGASLPARDIVAATRLQQQYFDHLCVQAGLGGKGCNLAPYDRGGWTLVVQQGMNDIDRRCDAYLEWLDNRKRSKGPLLSQISAIQSATTAIMGLIDPSSGAALSIVGQAFGLLNKSIENYHSRLLLEIESSTINSVVLNALHDFRKAVRGKYFETRPEAEYALREYMRRCLPFAIESQINDLSTLGSQGRDVIGARTVFQEPVSQVIVPASEPLKPDQGFGTKPKRADPQKVDPRILSAFTGTGFVEADLRDLQEVLCLQPSGFGGVGPELKLGIKLFEATPWNPALGLPDKVKDGKISPKEWEDLSNEMFCDRGTYRNYFEKERYSDVNRMKNLITLLNEKAPTAPYAGDPSLSSAVLREKIKQVRLIVAPEEFGANSSDQLTPLFISKLQAG